jgi:hypothetical protein
MPKPAAQINAWIREQELRLGICNNFVVNSNALTGAALPTVTVMLPSMAAVTRVAHAAADANMAADPRYDEMCERLDAELREILEGCSLKSNCSCEQFESDIAPRVPRVMTND